MKFAHLALAAFCLPALAWAQQPASLVYSQPLSPNAVTVVQRALSQRNAYSGAADGVWGQDSAAALERFQQSHQLQVTGGLNPATAQALGLDPVAILGSAPVETTTNRSANLTPGSVRLLQDRLRAAGYYRGPSDGVWGGGTEQALRSYQQARGLPPSGDMTANTISNLGLTNDQVRYR